MNHFRLVYLRKGRDLQAPGHEVDEILCDGVQATVVPDGTMPERPRCHRPTADSYTAGRTGARTGHGALCGWRNRLQIQKTQPSPSLDCCLINFSQSFFTIVQCFADLWWVRSMRWLNNTASHCKKSEREHQNSAHRTALLECGWDNWYFVTCG